MEDPATREMVEEADVVEGCRAIGFTLGIPAIGMLGRGRRRARRPGLRRGPRAQRGRARQVADVPTGAPHNVANALAAAALARALGVAAVASATACGRFRLDRHRIEAVAVVAASLRRRLQGHEPACGQASLRAFDHVVWIAGGLAKGATFDELVRGGRDRLRAAVLFGADRASSRRRSRDTRPMSR